MKDKPLYLVAGLGKTGLSIARFLTKRHCSIILFDTRSFCHQLEQIKQEFPKAEVYLEQFPLHLLLKIKQIVTSPGVVFTAEQLSLFEKYRLSVTNDIQYLADNIKAPIIGITGTNGKSTVTTLLGEMAKAANIVTAVAGNIGTPVLEVLDKSQNDYELWVLELSSFQLQWCSKLKLKAATVLNITPDHLDRHQSLENYADIKQNIYQNAETRLYNRQDNLTKPNKAGTCFTSFGLDMPKEHQWGIIHYDHQDYLAKGSDPWLSVNALKIKGQHNWQNALAAMALADSLNIDKQTIIKVLTEFPGLTHRCQWIRTLDNVEWINDSKGTNIGAAVSAIEGIGQAIQGKIVWIGGGQGKGVDFSSLKKTSGYLRQAILIGEDALKIYTVLKEQVPTIMVNSLKEAVLMAREKACYQDAVLLSPACASYDMFTDFNHRGEVFSDLVRQL